MPTIPAEIIHGDLPLLLNSGSGTIAPEGTLDTDTIEALCQTSTWLTEMAELGYVRNEKVAGTHAMFVEEFQRGPLGGSLIEIQARIIGLREPGEKRKRVISCGGQQISIGPVEKTIVVWQEDEQGEDPETSTPVEQVRRRVPKLDEFGEPINVLFVTPSGSAERWTIGDAILQVSDTYFVTGDTPPSTTIIGTAQTPPTPPTPPTSPWDGYLEPMRARHPFGWVLENREIDILFPGLWAVRDSYSYYYPATPD